MTENGFGSGTRKSDRPERVFGTDGCAVSCLEVRVVGEDGKPVPDEQEGRLQVRGAGQFVGYLKRPERYDTDGQGWFETGDNARMDADGYIRISGRSKDIIIRGGENIPVVEVEELLYRHPGVADCAIVAMPDERLGERACAFVTLRPESEGADIRGDVRLPAGAPAGEALPARTPGIAGRHAAHRLRQNPQIPPARICGGPQANEGMSAPKVSRKGRAFSV